MEECGSAGSSEERCIRRAGRSSEAFFSFDLLFARIILETKTIFGALTRPSLISHRSEDTSCDSCRLQCVQLQSNGQIFMFITFFRQQISGIQVGE